MRLILAVKCILIRIVANAGVCWRHAVLRTAGLLGRRQLLALCSHHFWMSQRYFWRLRSSFILVLMCSGSRSHVTGLPKYCSVLKIKNRKSLIRLIQNPLIVQWMQKEAKITIKLPTWYAVSSFADHTVYLWVAIR